MRSEYLDVLRHVLLFALSNVIPYRMMHSFLASHHTRWYAANENELSKPRLLVRQLTQNYPGDSGKISLGCARILIPNPDINGERLPST